jgi:hypothetical protein
MSSKQTYTKTNNQPVGFAELKEGFHPEARGAVPAYNLT